jgi:hypothetical protein
MIAFFVAITFAVNINHRKNARESLHKNNINKLSDKKGRKVIFPKNSADCYDAYKAFYDALETPDATGERLNSAPDYQKNKDLNLMSKKVKVLEVAESIITAFETECTTTYTGGCETFVTTTLVKDAVKDTDQAAFKAACEVADPSAGGGGGGNGDEKNDDIGLLTLNLSNYILLLSLAIANFYFIL